MEELNINGGETFSKIVCLAKFKLVFVVVTSIFGFGLLYFLPLVFGLAI